MNTYNLKILVQDHRMQQMSDIMSRLDLGIDGFWEPLEMSFTTTTVWTKEKVQDFMDVMEKGGLKVHRHDYKLSVEV